jgi:hypothetical protein
MKDERDLSELQLYGAEDFEELDMILQALDAANDERGSAATQAAAD